jgi:hypothetical protein
MGALFAAVKIYASDLCLGRTMWKNRFLNFGVSFGRKNIAPGFPITTAEASGYIMD